jgi:tRNA (guanine37-N1)-methyltransferase
MHFDVLTIFPEAISGFIRVGILGQAIENGLLSVDLHDLRDFTNDPHRIVDDRPYGGGPGMLLKVEPIVRGIEEISSTMKGRSYRKVLLSSQGRLFKQDDAIRWAKLEGMLLICGRYEGVDERVMGFVDEEVSIGNYVLTGGEVAAAAIIEATARMLAGTVGRFQSVESDSFYEKDHLGPPQYTRPPEFRGLSVPEVLLSGDHRRIEQFRQEKAWEKTMRNRPDLIGLKDADDTITGQKNDLDSVESDG